METKWLPNMAADINSRLPWLTAWSLKVQIFTTVGKTVSRRIEPGLRRKLLEENKRQSKEPKCGTT
jgi:hypothetical protein